jgi:hypothetical protein
MIEIKALDRRARHHAAQAKVGYRAHDRRRSDSGGLPDGWCRPCGERALPAREDMTDMARTASPCMGFSLFRHGADLGVHCHDPTAAIPFEQAARAITAAITVEPVALDAMLESGADDLARIEENGRAAPKDVGAVVLVTKQIGLARRVARLRPIVGIKG